jgi:hypothetical protein
MKLRSTLYVLALVLLVLAVSACGSSPTATPTPKPTVPPPPTLPPTIAAPTVAPTAVPPTPTPLPPTATPVPAQATTKEAVNVRQGPSAAFPVSGKMPTKTTAVILGKSEDGKWYMIAFPDAASPSWISVAYVTVTGPVEQLPVMAVAPPPTATAVAVAKAKATPVPSLPPVPAAKGVVGFVSYDTAQQSFVLNNVILGSTRNVSGFKLLGTSPIDLSQNTNAAPFAWAPDGSGRVAWVYGVSGAMNVLRVTDSAGNDRNLFSHQGISSPSWSPDSKAIAYIGMDNNFGTQFIYTIGPDGSNRQPLFPARTDKPESFRGVAWGKTHFLFVSNYTGNYEIWRMNSDGSGPFQLTNDKRENGSPAWSPDGTRFAYYSRQTDGSYQIMVANADGSSAKKMTNAGNNFTPTWSPDGNWIAFSSTRGGRLDVYIMDKNGNNVQPLTDKFTESQLPASWR